MSQYVEITAEQITELLLSFKAPPDRRSSNPRLELHFDWLLPASTGTPRRAVRLYTSVMPAGVSRPAGADAIRVVFVVSPGAPASEHVVGGLTRVHRVPGWEARVKERLTLAWKLLRHAPRCPNPACGASMVPRARRSKDRKQVLSLFWGCSRFPSCRCTRKGVKGKDYRELLPPPTVEG